ncbi:MAG: glycosyltransferase [bacterium]|nr:glycosyltransferase [bacterium]
MKHCPSLTVVMPVRNEVRHIGAVLDQLLAQSLAPERFEILVVDGMSTDGTRELVRDYSRRHDRIRLVDNPRFLAGSARNIGAFQARAPYIIFVDGHCRIASERMLESALKAFESGERCLSRPQPLYGDGEHVYSQAAALARSCVLGHHAGSRIYEDRVQHCDPVSAGCAYSRELYFAVGNTDEDFDAGEDIELNFRVKRLGVSAFHSNDLTVGYCARGSLGAVFRQLYRYGYGRARLLRKHPDAASLPPLALGAVTFGALVLPLLGIGWVPALRIWLLGIALYLLVVIGVSARLASRVDGRLFGPLVLCFPTIHFGAGLGFLAGLLRGPTLSHVPASTASQALVFLCSFCGAESGV